MEDVKTIEFLSAQLREAESKERDAQAEITRLNSEMAKHWRDNELVSELAAKHAALTSQINTYANVKTQLHAELDAVHNAKFAEEYGKLLESIQWNVDLFDTLTADSKKSKDEAERLENQAAVHIAQAKSLSSRARDIYAHCSYKGVTDLDFPPNW
jgi:hypothetical protein